jgi:hypothetical protein
MKYYHGSHIDFPLKHELRPQSDGYVQTCEAQDLEHLFESLRPKGVLSRKQSVFMSNNMELIDPAGGHTDVIYGVSPNDTVFPSDLAWYSDAQQHLEKGNIQLATQCAQKYWSGEPFYVPEQSCFEYRTRSATVTEIADKEPDCDLTAFSKVMDDVDKAKALFSDPDIFSAQALLHDTVLFEKMDKTNVGSINQWLNRRRNLYCEDKILLFHGTHAEHQIESEGINRTKASTKRSMQSQTGYVYLSAYPHSAKSFAIMGYTTQDVKVYAVIVPIRDLRADLDQLRNKRMWDPSLAPVIKATLADSLVYGSGFRVKRDIQTYELRDCTELFFPSIEPDNRKSLKNKR